MAKLGADYRLGRVLGEGGGGVVYEGERVFDLGSHGRIERPCAVKLIHADNAHNPPATHAFTREALLGYEITVHPNLVATRDLRVTSDDGRPFLVMERLAYRLEDLSDRVAGDLPMIRAIAESVLAALSHVHERGMVHRDVHSGNVYVSADGSIKLGDLGRAACIRDAREYRPRDDLYRLGLILRGLLAGRIPFDVGGKLVALPEDTPDELRVLVERLTRARTSDTALSARELSMLLRVGNAEIASARSIAARFSTSSSDAAAAGHECASESVSAPAPKSESAPARPSRHAIAAAMALVAGMAGALLTLAVVHFETPRPATPSSITPASPGTSDEPQTPHARPESTANQPAEQRVHRQSLHDNRADNSRHEREQGQKDTTRSHHSERLSPSVRVADMPQLTAAHRSNRYMESPRMLLVSRRGKNVFGVRGIVTRGVWLSRDQVQLSILVDNESSKPYHLTHIELKRADGRSIPVHLGEFNPGAGATSSISIIPADGLGEGTILVRDHPSLSGQTLSLVLNEPDGMRAVVISGLEWP